MVTVVNAYNSKGLQYKVYCGRKSSYLPEHGLDFSKLGNPFWMSNESKRDEVCDKYENYFNSIVWSTPFDSDGSNDDEFITSLDLLVKLHKICGDINLVCFCAPKRCHCDTIKKYIDNKKD